MITLNKLLIAVIIIISFVFTSCYKQEVGKKDSTEQNSETGRMKNEKSKETKTEDNNVQNIKRLIENQNPTFKMITSNVTEYLDKKLTIYGYVEIRSFYNYGYSDAQKTHYSTRIYDDKLNYLEVYFPKNNNKELFELLGKSEKGIPMKIEAKILTSRSKSEYTGTYYSVMEGLSWEAF